MDWNKISCGVGNNVVIFELDSRLYASVNVNNGSTRIIPYWLNIAKADPICSPTLIDEDVLKRAKDIINKTNIDDAAYIEKFGSIRKYDRAREKQKILVSESERRERWIHL